MRTTPIEFVDTSLRDGHQSLLATRMSTEQCMRALPLIKRLGYRVLELWGGATLDAALRFTGDDPWDRLDRFEAELNGNGSSGGDHVEIRSLCRGQNLFGYSPYHDSIVFSFMREAVRSGNDRVRIFDALNDSRNLLTATMSVKTFDGHAECAMSYTTSPVHDTDHFLRFADDVVRNGATSLAIKDMAGLLHPSDCFALTDGLRERFPGMEITLHSHGTNGLATASYVAGLVAGIDKLDTAHGPLANSTSQPSIELLDLFCKAAGVESNVSLADAGLVGEIDSTLRTIRRELSAVDKGPEHMGEPWPQALGEEPSKELMKKVERALGLIASRDRDKIDEAIALIEDEILVPQGFAPVDRTQLDAQVPGGMISNLHNQMKEQGKLDLMPKILEEIPRVRAEAGYLPLVTPTSQIVGTQAAMNVMTGARYSMVTKEFKNVILGLYGRTPGDPDPDVVKKCSPDGARLDKPPRRYAPEPDLNAMREQAGELMRTERDQLLYQLFPVPAKKFFEQRKAG